MTTSDKDKVLWQIITFIESFKGVHYIKKTKIELDPFLILNEPLNLAGIPKLFFECFDPCLGFSIGSF